MELSKQNQSLRSNYLAMNLHDRDIRRAALEEGFSQGISQGISQGAEQAKIETAKNLLRMNLSIEQVVQGTGLDMEKVIQIQNSELGIQKSSETL